MSDSPLFRDADPSILRAISLRMKRHHYLPGHYVVYQGDEVRAIYLVKRGSLDVLRNKEHKGQLSKYSATQRLPRVVAFSALQLMLLLLVL